MKQLTKMLAAVMAIGMLFSCEPVEDRQDLPAINLRAADINISVIQNPANPNEVTMTNLTDDIIPYWSYTNAAGDALGHSNQHTNTVTFPFAGTYTIQFTAYTRGGAVDAAPVTVTISENNEEYFADPAWAMLTNGVEGKKWKLNMASPVGWTGLDFPAASGDNWSWLPDYAGNEWVMTNKDWGSMTFDLDGNYNVSVTQTALTTNDQTTKTGTFSYDIANSRIVFNGGPEVLFGGDYYPDVSNWVSVKVAELTDDSMRLGVVRDQSRTGEGVCLIMFHYVAVE
ncbi:hypothetical protein AM493_12505 [Flavobacterium akiainvivens]|uniref:PKD domain-containing protein n=1 Tax=Flavobacterium akiainvivens TaxID=1202724 RepID=A0A0M8MCH5_9FLAO|nr:hypothetical protein [Flavobacterium akiainvivens]KOS08343.1 hypothetical protein AM493_12505 [Flavobacterium akiainvivens]